MCGIILLNLGDFPVGRIGVVAQTSVVQRRNNSTIVAGNVSSRISNLLAAGSGSIANNLDGVSNRSGSDFLKGYSQRVIQRVISFSVHAFHDGILGSINRNAGIAKQEGIGQVLGIGGIKTLCQGCYSLIAGHGGVIFQHTNNFDIRFFFFQRICHRRKRNRSDKHDCYQHQAEKLFAQCLHFVFLLKEIMDWIAGTHQRLVKVPSRMVVGSGCFRL